MERMTDVCKHREELINLYLDGMLEEAEQRRFEAHMAECGDCRRAMETMQRVFVALESYRPEPVPAGFADEVLARLPGRPRPGARLVWLISAVEAIAAIILMTLGWPQLTALYRAVASSVAPDWSRLVTLYHAAVASLSFEGLSALWENVLSSSHAQLAELWLAARAHAPRWTVLLPTSSGLTQYTWLIATVLFVMWLIGNGTLLLTPVRQRNGAQAGTISEKRRF
jgi:predicted anti-sigma-YlaC factor YlaD